MHFDVISRLRQSQLKFVVTISGGGSPFLSDYLSVPGASQTFLEARIPYAPLATDDFLGFHPENYTSERTARLLAAAALRRSQILAPDANPLALLGVGATAALVSERPKKGAHRVHCSILSRLGTFSASMTLKKNARTRAQEERLAADFIFSTLMKTMEKVEQGSHKFWAENREILPLRTLEPLSCDDVAEFSSVIVNHEAATFLYAPDDSRGQVLLAQNGRVDPLPRYPQKDARYLIFPGSFNPAHRGHAAIAQIASSRLNCPVEFEISAHNVDKPPLDPLELTRRVIQLNKLVPKSTLWIVNAPRFVQKARLFPGAIFIVGTDTILRLADPKYENNCVAQLDSVLEELRALNARFLVFTRRIDGKILSSDALVDKLPGALRQLCEFLPQDVFIDDVSSSEIRKQEKENW